MRQIKAEVQRRNRAPVGEIVPLPEREGLATEDRLDGKLDTRVVARWNGCRFGASDARGIRRDIGRGVHRGFGLARFERGGVGSVSGCTGDVRRTPFARRCACGAIFELLATDGKKTRTSDGGKTHGKGG